MEIIRAGFFPLAKLVAAGVFASFLLVSPNILAADLTLHKVPTAHSGAGTSLPGEPRAAFPRCSGAHSLQRECELKASAQFNVARQQYLGIGTPVR